MNRGTVLGQDSIFLVNRESIQNVVIGSRRMKVMKIVRMIVIMMMMAIASRRMKKSLNVKLGVV